MKHGKIIIIMWPLDSAESCDTFSSFTFFFFFFWARTVISHRFTIQETKITIYALFITVYNTVHALKNIKNGSHGTIYAFKNYFATVLSVFSFSNNKLNPNG